MGHESAAEKLKSIFDSPEEFERYDNKYENMFKDKID